MVTGTKSCSARPRWRPGARGPIIERGRLLGIKFKPDVELGKQVELCRGRFRSLRNFVYVHLENAWRVRTGPGFSRGPAHV